VRYEVAQQAGAEAAALPRVLDEQSELGRALIDQAAARQRDDPAGQRLGLRG
jgi:hypothetical protein